MAGSSDFIVYVDESGDHGLLSIDPEFPVFVLAFCIFTVDDYVNNVTPKIQNFKFQHFGHDIIILHEHEIRKTQPPFQMLRNKDQKNGFMGQLGQIIESVPFTVIAVAIDKTKFLTQHSEATNPYDIAMRLGLERLHKFLCRHGKGDNETMVIFEARGRKEDRELELEFRRVCDGLNYRGDRMNLNCVIASKLTNSCGLQLADLIARPIARKIIKPEQPNRAFSVIEKKLDRSARGRTRGWGLKVYP